MFYPEAVTVWFIVLGVVLLWKVCAVLKRRGVLNHYLIKERIGSSLIMIESFVFHVLNKEIKWQQILIFINKLILIFNEDKAII
ncbi:hypothetical protein [uncultured Shewanella sp.]|uniref:hypothetical protein n=1 Tax=uncultured Shewanella sp. TaxID=173975 RepID=UPI00261FD205|nr:hypothetical protein [uncultured Shewanella sp.]